MSVANKVRALLNLHGKEQNELAAALGISKQSLSNKFYRDSFSTSDLIKIADFLGCSLAFVMEKGQQVILDTDDLRERPPEG